MNSWLKLTVDAQNSFVLSITVGVNGEQFPTFAPRWQMSITIRHAVTYGWCALTMHKSVSPVPVTTVAIWPKRAWSHKKRGVSLPLRSISFSMDCFQPTLSSSLPDYRDNFHLLLIFINAHTKFAYLVETTNTQPPHAHEFARASGRSDSILL